ncbi:MAG: hypothetical protein F9K29_18775 [Hyphomicrobiaceae bacterium]|nr:MAG: hypothetical protein F9K29_18775 [Hyphomicrobiaceae bacterium]
MRLEQAHAQTPTTAALEMKVYDMVRDQGAGWAEGKSKKGLRPEWGRTTDALFNAAAIACACLFIAACLYRRLWQASWSGAEAIEALWIFYAAGGAVITSALLFRDKRT